MPELSAIIAAELECNKPKHFRNNSSESLFAVSSKKNILCIEKFCNANFKKS